MDTSLKLRRMELRAKQKELQLSALGALGKGALELGKAALDNPGLGMALSVAGVEALNRAKLINETERGLLVAVVISSDFLRSFTPVKVSV